MEEWRAIPRWLVPRLRFIPKRVWAILAVTFVLLSLIGAAAEVVDYVAGEDPSLKQAVRWAKSALIVLIPVNVLITVVSCWFYTTFRYDARENGVGS